jgi:hypothetical protein
MLLGQAILVALKMAVTDLAPRLLPGVDVNLTCIDSRCRDIPAYNAMLRLADEQAGGVGVKKYEGLLLNSCCCCCCCCMAAM